MNKTLVGIGSGFFFLESLGILVVLISQLMTPTLLFLGLIGLINVAFLVVLIIGSLSKE